MFLQTPPEFSTLIEIPAEAQLQDWRIRAFVRHVPPESSACRVVIEATDREDESVVVWAEGDTQSQVLGNFAYWDTFQYGRGGQLDLPNAHNAP